MANLNPTRHGHDAYEVVSALQKAIRRSDPDEAVYWAVELATAGYGAWFFARARVIAVEDCSFEAVGLVADVHALGECWSNSKDRRNGGELLFVVRAALSLATAPRSRLVDWMVWHYRDRPARREVPDHALDMHTRRGRSLDRSVAHFVGEASRLEPWSGDLVEMETRYRALAEAHKPAHNSHKDHSGQLHLGDAE